MGPRDVRLVDMPFNPLKLDVNSSDPVARKEARVWLEAWRAYEESSPAFGRSGAPSPSEPSPVPPGTRSQPASAPLCGAPPGGWEVINLDSDQGTPPPASTTRP
eukprot:scaffold32168_cov96-Isochrysis_galbana.AAC.1